MPNKNFYKKEFQKFERNRKSNTENQSISNGLPDSDLRNKLNKNKRKPNIDKIVKECQSGEIDETEWRIGEIQIGNKQVFTSDDLEVYKEYVQWDFINNKLYVKCENVLKIVDNRRKKEFKNTLKSWFNLINKDFKEVVKYEYYPILPKISVEYVAAQFLRKELIAKQFVTEKDANDKIIEILKFISTNHSQVPPRNVAGPMNVEYDKDENILIVNKFQSLKAPRDKLLSDRNEIISTAKLLLREESLGEFHDEEIRSAVECQQQQQQEQRARVNNGSEWRNPPPRYNKNNNNNNRNNNEEKKRKIDYSYKYSERNGKTVNESDLVDIHQSEWRNPPPRYNNRNNNNNNNNNRTDNNNKLSSSSSSQVANKEGQPELTRANSGLVWRNQQNDNDKQQQVLKVSNEEEQQQSDLVDNHQSEWRNPPPRYSNNNQSMKKSSDKVIKSSRDIDLYKEFVQWDFINNELYERGELLLDIRTGRERREFTNTLQRWFIFINEDYNEVPKYEYFTILPNIPLEHPAAQFLRDALIEKEFANEDDADDKMRKILGFISRNHSQVVPHKYTDPLHVEHDPDRKIVVVNKFQSAEVPRVNLLVEKGGVIAAARMLLRYESFGNGSYQWGDPEEVHKILHDKFNVRYEGFASPVNSRFIEYDDTHFCSLFPETDEPFGSIGNFFHVDMKKHAGGWSVNPPFLNDLMKNVADRINEILDAGCKCYFFCTFPWWEDDEGWNILNHSRYLLKRFDLLPQHFKVQDAYGNKFEPNMKMNMFVMGELPSTVAKLTVLGQELIINREDIKDHDIRVKLDKNYKNCPW